MASARAFIVAGLSVALHVAAAGVMRLLYVPPPVTKQIVSITLRDPAPRSPTPPADPSPRGAPDRPPPRRLKTKAASPHGGEPAHRAQDPATPPATSRAADETKPATQTPRKIDLAGAIAGAAARIADSSPGAASPRDPGGRTGRIDPNAPRDPRALGAEASRVIAEFIDEDKARRRVQSGQVPPRWFDAARVAQSRFSPSRDAIGTADPGALARSVLNPGAPSGEGALPEVPGGPANPFTSGLNGGFNTPTSVEPIVLGRRLAEVEVVVGPDGAVRSARIVRRSGSRAFDAAALAEVERTLREIASRREPLDEKGPVRLRWAVESRREMPRPTMGNPLGLGFGGGGRPVDVVGLERTRSSVSLLAYGPMQDVAVTEP